MKKDYHKNVELALNSGFEESRNEKAYRGKCYKKDGVGWIHDIEALKTSLNINKDRELEHLNYDVESYYKYVNHTNEMVDQELETIKAAIYSSDSVLSGKHYLLSDKKILQGMVDLASEGFDEEVLADFAHQMLKK